MRRPRPGDLDRLAGLEGKRSGRVVIEEVVSRIPSDASTFVIEYSIGVAHVLHINVSVRRVDIPASLHQAEGEAALGSWRTDVPGRRDGADAVGQHVVPGNVPPGDDGNVARLATLPPA